MGKKATQITFLAIILIVCIGAIFLFNYDKNYMKPVNNQTYKDECGACHFAYQPELLPSASWITLLAKRNDHFGEVVLLDDDSKNEIADYLISNSAEKSTATRSIKIMKSLKNGAPLRVTDIPYIHKKHNNEFSLDVLKRKSIGSLSNCSACHTTADKGIYEDDYVEIPK
jgi:hypothetical protein